MPVHLRRLAMAAVSTALLATNAAAKPPEQVDWLLAATTKHMVVFFDNAAGRGRRNPAEATVVTFHVLSTPKQMSGGKISWFSRRSKYDCLKKQVSQQSILGYDENEVIVFSDTT